ALSKPAVRRGACPPPDCGLFNLNLCFTSPGLVNHLPVLGLVRIANSRTQLPRLQTAQIKRARINLAPNRFPDAIALQAQIDRRADPQLPRLDRRSPMPC